MATESGNGFYNLVPFSKHPYKYDNMSSFCLYSLYVILLMKLETVIVFLIYVQICGRGSEYEDDGIAESLKEEKKRKQREAVAEDLFNNARVHLNMPVHILIIYR